MKRVALFGGSFDPPHLGHKAVVDALLALEYVDKVIIMPTFLNPFKSSSCAPAQLRLQWLSEIFSDYKNVEISSFEVDKKRKVASIESVEHLQECYQMIYLVIGADNLASLPKWYQFEKLKKSVTFIVASRDGISVPREFITLNIDAKIASSSLRVLTKKEQLAAINANKIITYYKEKNER